MAAAPEGGGGGEEAAKPKKPKLTKEEKIRRAKEAALNAVRKYMSSHLDREIKFTQKTYKRASDDWYKMCKDIKMEQLKVDMMGVWQDLNQAIDRKNYKIKVLMDELDVAEEQYQRNFSKHTDILTYLIDFFQSMLNATKDMYEARSTKMIHTFFMETQWVGKIQGDRKIFYENLLHAMNFLVKKRLDDQRALFEAHATDVIDSNIVKRYNYRDQTIESMENSFNELKTVVQSVLAASIDPERQVRYNQLMDRQLRHDIETAHVVELNDKGHHLIFELQKRLQKTEAECNFNIMEIKLERKFFVENYWKLKEKHKQEVTLAEKQLSILASESYKAISELKRLEKYGELLMGLASCCRKSQTEKEKVTPWPEDDTDLVNVVEDSEEIDEYLEEMQQLRNFWLRVSHAYTHVTLLRDEKKKLLEERDTYCNAIKEYYEVQGKHFDIASLIITNVN